MLKIRCVWVHVNRNWYDSERGGCFEVADMDALTTYMADRGLKFEERDYRGIIFSDGDCEQCRVTEILDAGVVIYSCGWQTVSHEHVGARAKRLIDRLEHPEVRYGD